MFMNVREVCSQMNSHALQGKDFLFAFDFELKEGIFVENPLEQKDIWFEIEGMGNVTDFPEVKTKRIVFNSCGVDRTRYMQGFDIASKALQRGDSFLLNLTAKTPIMTNLSLEDIFMVSKARYKLLVKNSFVCFSPECFIRTEEDRIYTYPMKGTIDADIPQAEKILSDNPKEQAEHYTIVDLMRNDLNRISSEVSVERFRYFERIDTMKGPILQTSSEISGILPDNWRSHAGDIMLELLPAGSISGAPKKATVETIRLAEKERRGFYTGVFGYFDGKNLESAVMIRYIEQEGSRLFFRSGGGITVNSRAEDEYMETEQKIYLPLSI